MFINFLNVNNQSISVKFFTKISMDYIIFVSNTLGQKPNDCDSNTRFDWNKAVDPTWHALKMSLKW